MSTDFELNIDLLEQTAAWYFSLDNRDQKEYLYKKRTGLLQRRINKTQVNKSIELSSTIDAKPFLSHSVPPASFRIREKEIAFNPGKILRENELIFKLLRELKLQEWKIIARANHTGRTVLKNNEKDKKTDFTYFSILVKLKLKGQRNYIEIGEGSFQGLKINQDGLSSRIKKIVENHRSRKLHTFTDKVPVILNSGDGAIIFHELLGHSLEADYVYRGLSPISHQSIGQAIMPPKITLTTYDPNDHFFKGFPCDDEGERANSPLLIENGILRNLISDCAYKHRLNLENCGHSRVEDFSKIPMPRMFALYVQPGSFHPGDLIASTKYGVYASEFGEGKVFFDKKMFYFNIREAWLIKDGKISDALGSIVVRGHILEALNSVEMVADDFRYDKGLSYCFKNGQTLNVRVGQPTVKVNNLYISRELED